MPKDTCRSAIWSRVRICSPFELPGINVETHLMLGATGMQRMSGRSVSSATHHIAIWAFVAAGLLLQSGRAEAMSVAKKKHIALDQYHKAVQMREALNGRPGADRDTEDYNRVIDAFRKVYHLAPTST